MFINLLLVASSGRMIQPKLQKDFQTLTRKMDSKSKVNQSTLFLLGFISNWQAHLIHFILMLLATLWFQPSFNIYGMNGSFILSESIYSILWILSFSLLSLKGFIMLHDCGHNAFFESASNNELFGRILSLFVCTPFYFWQKAHNQHHAIQGRSDKLDLSATIHFTVNDVKNINNSYFRLLYIIFRIPLIFYLCTPSLIWWLWFPYISMKQKDYLPLIGHIIRPLLIYLFNSNGISFALCVGINIITEYIPAFLGVMLFHIQHSHNPSYRKNKEGFNRIEQSIDGSCCHKVPIMMKIFTMGIEFHSFHHFDTAIPGYKLEYFYHQTRDNNLQYDVKSKSKKFDDRFSTLDIINYYDIYQCMFHVVYDENAQRYITWSECVKQIYFS